MLLAGIYDKIKKNIKENTMSRIEEKLNVLYEYVSKFTEENGYPPTVRDICSDLSIKSTATAHYYLEKLSSKGLITKRGDKKRALTVSGKTKNSFDIFSK